MRLWRRKQTRHEVLYVPSDYEFLDPDRPEIRYVSDLTPEERERMAPQIEAMKKRAATGGQPPWTITLSDGTEIEVPLPSTDDERDEDDG